MPQNEETRMLKEDFTVEGLWTKINESLQGQERQKISEICFVLTKYYLSNILKIRLVDFMRSNKKPGNDFMIPVVNALLFYIVQQAEKSGIDVFDMEKLAVFAIKYLTHIGSEKIESLTEKIFDSRDDDVKRVRLECRQNLEGIRRQISKDTEDVLVSKKKGDIFDHRRLPYNRRMWLLSDIPISAAARGDVTGSRSVFKTSLKQLGLGDMDQAPVWEIMESNAYQKCVAPYLKVADRLHEIYGSRVPFDDKYKWNFRYDAGSGEFKRRICHEFCRRSRKVEDLCLEYLIALFARDGEIPEASPPVALVQAFFAFMRNEVDSHVIKGETQYIAGEERTVLLDWLKDYIKDKMKGTAAEVLIPYLNESTSVKKYGDLLYEFVISVPHYGMYEQKCNRGMVKIHYDLTPEHSSPVKINIISKGFGSANKAVKDNESPWKYLAEFKTLNLADGSTLIMDEEPEILREVKRAMRLFFLAQKELLKKQFSEEECSALFDFAAQSVLKVLEKMYGNGEGMNVASDDMVKVLADYYAMSGLNSIDEGIRESADFYPVELPRLHRRNFTHNEELKIAVICEKLFSPQGGCVTKSLREAEGQDATSMLVNGTDHNGLLAIFRGQMDMHHYSAANFERMHKDEGRENAKNEITAFFSEEKAQFRLSADFFKLVQTCGIDAFAEFINKNRGAPVFNRVVDFFERILTANLKKLVHLTELLIAEKQLGHFDIVVMLHKISERAGIPISEKNRRKVEIISEKLNGALLVVGDFVHYSDSRANNYRNYLEKASTAQPVDHARIMEAAIEYFNEDNNLHSEEIKGCRAHLFKVAERLVVDYADEIHDAIREKRISSHCYGNLNKMVNIVLVINRGGYNFDYDKLNCQVDAMKRNMDMERVVAELRRIEFPINFSADNVDRFGCKNRDSGVKESAVPAEGDSGDGGSTRSLFFQRILAKQNEKLDGLKRVKVVNTIVMATRLDVYQKLEQLGKILGRHGKPASEEEKASLLIDKRFAEKLLSCASDEGMLDVLLAVIADQSLYEKNDVFYRACNNVLKMKNKAINGVRGNNSASTEDMKTRNEKLLKSLILSLKALKIVPDVKIIDSRELEHVDAQVDLGGDTGRLEVKRILQNYSSAVIERTIASREARSMAPELAVSLV
jgi:hypothetical protein